MVGLVAGTLAGGLARDLRVADAGARHRRRLRRARPRRWPTPSSPTSSRRTRRGKAMGAVMGAFSVAQVLGVPGRARRQRSLRLARCRSSPWPRSAAPSRSPRVFLLPPLTQHRVRTANEPVATLPRAARAPDGAALVHHDRDADGVGLPRHPQPAGVRRRTTSATRASTISTCSPSAASPASSRCACSGRLVDRWGSFRAGSLGVVALARGDVDLLRAPAVAGAGDAALRRAHDRARRAQRRLQRAHDQGAAAARARALLVAAVDRVSRDRGRGVVAVDVVPAPAARRAPRRRARAWRWCRWR